MKTATERSLSEKEFRSFFEWSLGLMCVVDFETVMFTKVNPSFTRILGYSEEELLERTFLDFLHPDDIQPTLDIIEHRLKKGEAVPHFENRYRTK
ncbi:MAG: PAS domain S-box protein, partial [Planctomycetes bacterium]|nr:PAS domain S-box protein [Planctomycetota bacterium]